MRYFITAIIGSVIFLLSGCDDDQQNYDLTSSTSKKIISSSEEVPQWLDAYHAIPTEDWLVVRSAAALRGEVTDRQTRVNLLNFAAERFPESPRMIANRAIQLEDMLLEIHIKESAVSLIDMFSHLPIEGTPHNFSAYCQYYFNLRAKGYPQGYSLTELSKLK